ncbi:MAG: carboxymuconolactone decarboxylase family protein [Gemmatimonadales bacterium]
MRSGATGRADSIPVSVTAWNMMTSKQDSLDPQTRDLVRFAAAIAQGYEPELRERAGVLRLSQVPAPWIEELLLQSVLMVGYPRALVAFTIWRRLAGVNAPGTDIDQDYGRASEWTRQGEELCGVVYGDNYTKLRQSVRALHPALDNWMITEGYGRTLARPGLDLRRRELCIVAQTAVLETPRQLHSHLRGALNAGATFGQIEGTLSIVNPLLSFDQWKKVKELWRTVRQGWSPGN